MMSKHSSAESKEKKKKVGYSALTFFSVSPKKKAPIVPFGCQPPVTLHYADREITLPYLECFRSVPAVGLDGREAIAWYAFKFINLNLDDLQELIKSVQWDQKGMHEAYSQAEDDLLRKGANCVAIYSRNLRLSPEYWKELDNQFHKLAALRDYHDFRMGISQGVYKECSHLYQGKVSINNLRHHPHIFRTWNCTVFVRELRMLLEGEAREIPQSVKQLLVDGKDIPYVSEEDLKAFIFRIGEVYRSRRQSKRVGCQVASGPRPVSNL